MANLIYSPKDILQQEFKTKMRGYDPVEVDEFLDNIIKDYESYNKEILALQEENDRLTAKVDQLSKNQAIASRVQQEAPKSQTVTNFRESEPVTRSSSYNSNYTNADFEDDNEKTRQF